MRSADGANFSFARDKIRVTRLSPGICQIIFDIARNTNTYVNTEGSDTRPIQVAGAAAEIPPESSKKIVASDASSLCFTLTRRLVAWNREERREMAYGMIDSKGALLEPPASPQGEVPLVADPTGVAAQCAAQVKRMSEMTGERLATVVVSQSPKWGVVWRADVIPKDYPDYVSREICWRRPGTKDGLTIEDRPLQMFKAADSVAPLTPP